MSDRLSITAFLEEIIKDTDYSYVFSLNYSTLIHEYMITCMLENRQYWVYKGTFNERDPVTRETQLNVIEMVRSLSNTTKAKLLKEIEKGE